MAKAIRIFSNPKHDRPDRRKPRGKSSLIRKAWDEIVADASTASVKVPFGITKMNRKQRRAMRFGETLPHMQHQQGKTALGRKGKDYRHTTDHVPSTAEPRPAKVRQDRKLWYRYSKKVGRGVDHSVANAVPKSPLPKIKPKT